MARVRVIVEGATEESFVSGPLYDALVPHGVFPIPTVLGVPGRKGGNVTRQRVIGDVLKSLKQDQGIYCSTLLDLYGLGDGFSVPPGLANRPGSEKADFLENALRSEVAEHIPQFRPDIRFIPYLQVHEFEGLLFSDTGALARGMYRPDLQPKLKAIRDAFASPEDINDDPKSAPSKRLMSLDGRYDKVISGTLAAEEMGIEAMRSQCPRFRQWVDRLVLLT